MANPHSVHAPDRWVAKDCPLAPALAERLRSGRRDLTAHWLSRIVERVSIRPNSVFPTQELLDHVPLLIDGIANYLENPAYEVSADTPVVAKAMELGAMRHTQGFDVYEILKEYEILGGILFTHLAQAADEMPEPCAKSELLACGQRLFQAISIVQQATTTQYLRLADAQIADREARLRGFNRTVSHELKNHIGAVLGASDILCDIPDLPPDQRAGFYAMIARNARGMKTVVENLIALSAVTRDARKQRHIQLPAAVQEATRLVRDAARSAGVAIRIMELPAVEVHAAAVELCVTNYLSNAIKYANPQGAERFVEISGAIEERPTGPEIVVRVRDNGVGVPREERDQLFQLFFRTRDATVTGTEGTGLGLNIVRETAESLGGRAWAEFPEGATIFAFSLPYRRGASVDKITG